MSAIKERKTLFDREKTELIKGEKNSKPSNIISRIRQEENTVHQKKGWQICNFMCVVMLEAHSKIIHYSTFPCTTFPL